MAMYLPGLSEKRIPSRKACFTGTVSDTGEAVRWEEARANCRFHNSKAHRGHMDLVGIVRNIEERCPTLGEAVSWEETRANCRFRDSEPD